MENPWVKISDGNFQNYDFELSPSNFTGSINNVEIKDGDQLFITVISTPNFFSGDDYFDYQFVLKFN